MSAASFSAKIDTLILASSSLYNAIKVKVRVQRVQQRLAARSSSQLMVIDSLRGFFFLMPGLAVEVVCIFNVSRRIC